ncbi:MAG: Mut7-C RNAse domain-containing protein [Candidatus Omnitrophica bacterium]|nr:Mut7-C RNAse domain-containing protein [Candidatus Omnitrophota bacterium]
MRFLLTRELGRLAKWLRILGFDTVYFNQDNISPSTTLRTDGERSRTISSLIIQALRDERIIITRNHRLPKSGGIKIVLIKAEKLAEQLPEVLGQLKIKPDPDKMFTRCIICNTELVDVDKEKTRDKVPEYVFQTQDDFISCPECKRIYWSGTHWGNVKNTLEEIGVV